MSLKLLWTLVIVTIIGAEAHYDDDGHCPYGWESKNQLCYKIDDDWHDFRSALISCTDGARNEDDPWENLLFINQLRSFTLDSDHPKHYLGHGPYRLNAIKIHGKWKSWVGGNTYLQPENHHSGLEVSGFELFEDFDPEDSHDGDTIIYYPHWNRIKSVPHWEKYPALCEHHRIHRNSQRCPGIPECNHNGQCINGICYCYQGYVDLGGNCFFSPYNSLGLGGRTGFNKVIIVVGTTDQDDNEVFLVDLNTNAVCQLADYPLSAYASEGIWFMDKALVCGGYESNDPERAMCYQLDSSSGAWTPFADMPLVFEYAGSALTPSGWWMVGDYDETQDTALLQFDGTWTTGPSLPFTLYAGCACQISDTQTAIIGGERDYGGGYSDSDAITIYDWTTDTFTDVATLANPKLSLECEVVLNGNGDPIIVILGGTDVGVEWYDVNANTVTDAGYNVPYPGEDQELYAWTDDTLILSGADDAGTLDDKVYTYTLAGGFTEIVTLPIGHEESVIIGVPDYFTC